MVPAGVAEAAAPKTIYLENWEILSIFSAPKFVPAEKYVSELPASILPPANAPLQVPCCGLVNTTIYWAFAANAVAGILLSCKFLTEKSFENPIVFPRTLISAVVFPSTFLPEISEDK